MKGLATGLLAPTCIIATTWAMACHDDRIAKAPPPNTKAEPVGPTHLRDSAMHMITPNINSLQAPTVVLPQVESFTLTTPGMAPRSPLRYAFIDRTEDDVIAATITSRVNKNGEWSSEDKLPTLREGFAVTSSKAATDANGGTKLALRGLIGEVEGANKVTPAVATDAQSHLERWRQFLERRRLTIDVSGRGELGTITFADDVASASAKTVASRDEVVNRLLGWMVPLPVEDVGIGATWRVVTILRMGSAVVKQTATYTLLARTADRWTLDVEVTRVAEQQLVHDSAVPAGTTAELIGLMRETKGRWTVTPNSPFPSAGTSTFTLRVHGRLTDKNGPHSEASEDSGTLSFVHTHDADANK